MDEIEKYYKYMIENNPQFKMFVEKNKILTTDELIKKYDIKTYKEQES